MKREINTYMEITFENVDFSTLDRIEVIFRQYRDQGAVKRGVWRADGTGDCLIGGDNSILVPWTRAETRLFSAERSFWLDTRPTTAAGSDLETEPVELWMRPSIFEEVAE